MRCFSDKIDGATTLLTKLGTKVNQKLGDIRKKVIYQDKNTVMIELY